ncbi:MAG: hypothetical protein MUQ20_01910, partial [Deltaproteobacteria bacterium]|nr:hypothetical protein [Deltaproteobacteria bacterium]
MNTQNLENDFPFLKNVIRVDQQNQIIIPDKKKLREEAIDQLIRMSVFGGAEKQALASWLIWEV